MPQPNEQAKTAKDLVFTILSHKQPLSAIEIYNTIKKNYNLNITYFAVRKALNILSDEKVLEKENKKYKIDKKWILNLKSFFDKLLLNYEKGKQVHNFTADTAKEDYAVYTFNNLLDLDNFWGEIQVYWANHEKTNKNYFSYTYFHWWLLINLGKETRIFEEFKKNNIKSICIFRNKLPLNIWASKIYKNLGANIKIKEKYEESPYIDINILGDTIIQVIYPEKLFKKIQKFYKRYKNTQQINLKEITELANENHEIRFILFKNPIMAKTLINSF